MKNVFFYVLKNKVTLNKTNYNFVFVYGISKNQIELTFKFIDEETKLVWVSLGGDIYNSNFISPKEIYQSETLKLLQALNIVKNNSSLKLITFIKKLTSNHKFFKRIDFVSPRLENEMNIINRNKHINAPYVRLPLGDNFERKNKVHESIFDNAKDIYIGPSASPTSNHLEIFKKIHELGFKNKIHVTLSYKINVKYQTEIIKVGKQLFGNNFMPQTKFYSKGKFENILNNCAIAMFNNNRQEGLLTISMCAEKGMKVFLSENNPSFKYLKDMGYNIFSIQNEFNLIKIQSVENSKPFSINQEDIFKFDEKKAIKNALLKME
jgi:hypothetical protein